MQQHWPEFTFAFQPIVDITSNTIISYEALVRGLNNEPAIDILESVHPNNKYKFDEMLRKQAISMASSLAINCNLNLNLLPCGLQNVAFDTNSTTTSAKQSGIALKNITLEVLESEVISDVKSFVASINEYRAQGIHISIDDFGAGYSGLILLAEFQPDSIKLDQSLVRNIDSKGPKQAIVRGIIRTCFDLGIDIVAEGVETRHEYDWCLQEGIEIYQGFLFAKPGFEHFPVVRYPN